MCIVVYKCLHQTASMYISESLCIQVTTSINQSYLSSAVQGSLVISYCIGQSDMDREALPSPGLLSQTHSHWQFVICRSHWLSSVHDWNLLCFVEPTIRLVSTSMTVSTVRFCCANWNLLIRAWYTCIKLFSASSGLRLVCCMSLHLNILCIILLQPRYVRNNNDF